MTRLRPWQAKRIEYRIVLRNGEWWIVENSRYGEAWRGPFKTQAEALARLTQYGKTTGREIIRTVPQKCHKSATMVWYHCWLQQPTESLNVTR